MPLFRTVFSFYLILSISSLIANPQNMQVISGDVTADLVGEKVLQISSESDKAILHWDHFSIDNTETTRFILPRSSSSVLNRITGKDFSAIDGLLESNGRVFLINSNGIIIGKEGMVKTAGFYASTLDVKNSEFMLENEMLFSGNSEQAVINLGTIVADGDNVMLLAKKVTHSGNIEAKKGTVGLAAGREILLKPMSKEKIFIKPILEEHSPKEKLGITNTGTIESLRSELKADGNLYALAIKDAGHIDALGSVEQNGEIFLFADDGIITTASSLTAEDGEIRLIAKRIAIADKAHISVSSENSAGTILIGGDYQGENPDIPNSEFLFVAPKSVIEAAAKTEGDGGKIILWGEKGVYFNGNISAEGNGKDHHGGFVEISSKGDLSIPGQVSTLCKDGKVGQLLLDPTNVTIIAGTAADNTLGGWSGGNPNTFSYLTTPSGDTTNLGVADLISKLVASDVVVTTSSTQTDAGNLIVDNSVGAIAFSWASANDLTLEADNDITINAMINSTSVGGANILLQAGGNVVIQAKGSTDAGISTKGTGQVSLIALAGDVQILGGTNGDATIDLQSSSAGALNIQAANNFEVVGGIDSSGSAGDAAIQNSGTKDISVISKTVSLRAGQCTGGSGGKSASANILHAGTGDIKFTVSGSLFELVGGIGSASVDTVSAFISHAGNTGNIVINAPNAELVIAGGDPTDVSSDSRAYILKQFGAGNIDLTSGGLFIAGGTGYKSDAAITWDTATGSLTCTIGGDVDLLGGSGSSSSDAKITVASGTFTNTITGDLNLQGGGATTSSSTSVAEISVTGGSSTFSGRNISLLGGSGDSSGADIFTSGNITINHQSGDIILLAGSGAGNTDSYIESSTGNLILNAKSLTLAGGSGASSNSHIETKAGTFQATLSEDYFLTAGSSMVIGALKGSETYFISSGDMVISGRNLSLKGGTGLGAYAQIESTAGNITTNLSGTSLIYGGSGLSGDTSASILADNQYILFNGGNLVVQGGTGVSSPAYIRTPKAGITLNLTGDCDVVAGSGLGANFAEISTGNLVPLTAGGSITITADDLFLQAGENLNQYAKVYVINGTVAATVTVNASGVVSLSSRGIGPSQILSIGDLNITAGQDVVVLRNSLIQNQQNPLNIIAGEDIYLGSFSKVANLNGSDLTLVVDNENPNFPDAGNNKLVMSNLATITNGGGKVRVFTSKGNKIITGALVNGEPFFETIQTTPQNQWGFYYPNSFFGGPGYTLFHKQYPAGTVPVFYGADLFYGLENWRETLFMINPKQKYIDRAMQFTIYYDCATYGGIPEYRTAKNFVIRAFR